MEPGTEPKPTAASRHHPGHHLGELSAGCDCTASAQPPRHEAAESPAAAIRPAARELVNLRIVV